MQLNFATYGPGVAVVPSDTTQITCRGIYVGGAGSVTVKIPGGTAVTFTSPPVGTILPIALDQGFVMAGTTATLLVALQ